MEAAAPRLPARAALVGRSDRDHPSRRARSPRRHRHGHSLSAGAADLGRCRRDRRGRAGAHRSRHHRGRNRHRARGVHLSCPQSEPFDPHRRRLDCLCAGRRAAELFGRRSWPAPRHLRGQCQLHQAGAAFQLHPHRRGRVDRCARRSCLGAAPPHRPEQGSALRQGAVHLLDRSRPPVRWHRDGADSPRRRLRSVPGRTLRVHDDQHQLAAEARRPDGDGRDRNGPSRADHLRHPVHARRRHGAGHPGRCPCRAERRGAGRPCPQPAGTPRRPLHLWRLHLQRRHEVRSAGLRNARIYEGGDRRRPDGAALPSALPHLQHLRRQRGRRPGRL